MCLLKAQRGSKGSAFGSVTSAVLIETLRWLMRWRNYAWTHCRNTIGNTNGNTNGDTNGDTDKEEEEKGSVNRWICEMIGELTEPNCWLRSFYSKELVDEMLEVLPVVSLSCMCDGEEEWGGETSSPWING